MCLCIRWVWKTWGADRKSRRVIARERPSPLPPSNPHEILSARVSSPAAPRTIDSTYPMTYSRRAWYYTQTLEFDRLNCFSKLFRSFLQHHFSNESILFVETFLSIFVVSCFLESWVFGLWRVLWNLLKKKIDFSFSFVRCQFFFVNFLFKNDKFFYCMINNREFVEKKFRHSANHRNW